MRLLSEDEERVNRWMDDLTENEQRMMAIHGIQASTITKRLDIIIWLLVVGLGIGLNALWRAGLVW